MDNLLMECIDRCRANPAIAPHARIVGRWVWMSFPNKPNAEVIAAMKEMGFRWNRKRLAWQNPCGFHTCAARGYDPRDKYGMMAIEDVYTAVAP